MMYSYEFISLEVNRFMKLRQNEDIGTKNNDGLSCRIFIVGKF